MGLAWHGYGVCYFEVCGHEAREVLHHTLETRRALEDNLNVYGHKHDHKQRISTAASHTHTHRLLHYISTRPALPTRELRRATRRIGG